jgi:murein DD-endopeptidase MepM/ murein hydrolase activator NlpD
LKLFGLKIVVLLFCIIAVVSLQAQSQLPSQASEQVEQWQQERQKKLTEKHTVEKQRNLIVKKERGVLQKLQQIESDLAANEKELDRYRKEIERHQLKAGELQIELRRLISQDKRYKKLVAKRVRAIYKIGYNGHHLHTLEILLGAQNMIDLLQKYKYMSVIAGADQAVLGQLQSQQDEILQMHLELVQRIKTIEAISKAAQAKRARILSQKEQREQLLHQYQTRKEIYNQTLEELRAAVVQFENLLGIVSEEGIEEKAKAIGGIRPDLLGKLPWPVVGKVVSNQTAIDRGITIQAQKGSPVRCVADGVVARTVESIVGYGNTILIIHGNGYISVYAHLSDMLVKKGDAVRAKKIIGTVGETGSLIGEVLYFELWHNYNRLNTQRWLTRRP